MKLIEELNTIPKDAMIHPYTSLEALCDHARGSDASILAKAIPAIVTQVPKPEMGGIAVIHIAI